MIRNEETIGLDRFIWILQKHGVSPHAFLVSEIQILKKYEILYILTFYFGAPELSENRIWLTIINAYKMLINVW